METLAFYSYKGGVGRSLLLANAARFLAATGKKVVALDLDLEAPGLHYKLEGTGGRAETVSRGGGAVPYLVATAQGAGAAPPLDQHMVEVPVPPGSRGWLRLMPAGPAPERAYWTVLKHLDERVQFDDPSGQGLLALLDLHARIRDELKPDYLLIDARTGVTELGGLATTILADIVVCMFVANQESLDGTLTVVEALKAAPRLAGQKPIRIVPVLSRATGAASLAGPLGAAVSRLLELGEAREVGRDWRSDHPPTLDTVVASVNPEHAERLRQSKPFVLPHDEIHGVHDRVVAGAETASAFSPLYKAYMELFQRLFPATAKRARQVLARSEAVASIKRRLTDPHLPRVRFGDGCAPWSASAVSEGVLFTAESDGPLVNRYADLVCRDDAGLTLMVVEYLGDEYDEQAKAFWEKHTDVRCVVFLSRGGQSNVVGQHIYVRKADDAVLERAARWDLPFPREFTILSDVGDRSVEAMVDALRHGHEEAAAWLVGEWRECILAIATHLAPPWRPVRARRILDGLAATEDPDIAEQILRRATPTWPEWRSQAEHDDMWALGGDLDEWMARDLFAPLFWRLPVEGLVKYVERGRHPDEAPCLAGYRLVAHDLLGLHYDPDRVALEEGRDLAREAQQPDGEPSEDGEDTLPLDWLHRSRLDRVEQLRLSNDPPPAFIWDQARREDPRWCGTLEQARGKVGHNAVRLAGSTAKLARWVREKVSRRDVAIEGLLGQRRSSGQIDLATPVIVAAAEALAVPPRFLKSVAFIHLSVLSLAHQARDLDGQPGWGFAPSAPSGPVFRECPVHIALAQAFTYRLIVQLEDPNLLSAFEKLSKCQPEPYRQWMSLRELPLEQLRVLLMRARGGAVAVGLPRAGAPR